LRRLLQRAAVLEVGGDPCRPKAVDAELGGDPAAGTCVSAAGPCRGRGAEHATLASTPALTGGLPLGMIYYFILPPLVKRAIGAHCISLADRVKTRPVAIIAISSAGTIEGATTSRPAVIFRKSLFNSPALGDTAHQLGRKPPSLACQAATAAINSANPTRLSTRLRL
jgi:hypothetical protein